jgi:hypothetical protein
LSLSTFRGEDVFCRLAYSDTLIIIRGLLILVVAILLGLSATEQQLNTLTERQEIGQIFDMNRNNEGVYSLEIVGSNYNISAVFAVAEIVNQDKSVNIITPFHSLIISKYIYLDCKKELAWLALEVGYLEQYIKVSWERINVYFRRLR